MKWEKLGLIFCPDGNSEWMYSHAANTVAEHIENDIYRVYFSCRTKENIASVGHIEIELKPPFNVLYIAEVPDLVKGNIGLFDDSGVSLSCIVNYGRKKYMYYLGWNLGVTVPWRNSIGIAEYDPNSQKFIKYSQAPLLDRCQVDPYSISYPYVLEDGDKFRMWYGSNLAWGKDQKDMAHLIKYAESEDPLNWRREGDIALNFKNEQEYAMSRPHVIKEKGRYRMWYSYRGDSYRIGYAESYDALNWERKDDIVGITTSKTGWDNESIEYPFIIDHKSERYMLYNGNSYGKTGFGIAVLEDDCE